MSPVPGVSSAYIHALELAVLDPRTHELMEEAVTLVPCGHVCSQRTAARYQNEGGLCGQDSRPIEQVIPNHTIREIIATLQNPAQSYLNLVNRLLTNDSVKQNESLRTLLTAQFNGLSKKIGPPAAPLDDTEIESFKWTQRLLIDGKVSKVVAETLLEISLREKK